MNIHIDDEGYLLIERAGNWKAQNCPFLRVSDDMESLCGDWCPHFGEPIIINEDAPELVHQLWLCHGKLLTGTLTDERGKE